MPAVTKALEQDRVRIEPAQRPGSCRAKILDVLLSWGSYGGDDQNDPQKSIILPKKLWGSRGREFYVQCRSL